MCLGGQVVTFEPQVPTPQDGSFGILDGYQGVAFLVGTAGREEDIAILIFDVFDEFILCGSRGGVEGENSNPDSDEDYNQAMLRSRKAIDEDYPYDEEHTWNWGSSDNPETTKHMSHYSDILRNYRISRIAFQISVGALILNRVISILDVMRIYRSTSNSLAEVDSRRWNIFPEFRPEGPGATFLLTF